MSSDSENENCHSKSRTVKKKTAAKRSTGAKGAKRPLSDYNKYMKANLPRFAAQLGFKKGASKTNTNAVEYKDVFKACAKSYKK